MSKATIDEIKIPSCEGAQVLSNIYNTIPQNLPNNSRYFYIRIVGFPIFNTKDDLGLEGINKLRMVFQMSDKTSFSDFELQKQQMKQNNLTDLRNETHLFCYEAEQILNITFVNISGDKQKQKEQERRDKIKEKQKQSKQTNTKIDKNKQKISTFKSNIIGYSKILMTPFAVMPYTRHQVKVDIIPYNESTQKERQKVVMAQLKLQIFYLFDFQAEIQISPISAEFTKNTGLIGTMRPCCILILNEQRKKSMLSQQGGIYPRWQKQARVLQERKKKRNLDEQGWDLEIFDTKYQKEAITNKFKFNLRSVGHTLKILTVNFPFFDKDAEIIGQTQIRIQSFNMLKIPGKEIYHQKQNSIKLYTCNPITKQKQAVGRITLRTKFIFDAEQIRKDIQEDQDQRSDSQLESNKEQKDV